MLKTFVILALGLLLGRGYSATLDEVMLAIKEDTSGGPPLGNLREKPPYNDPDGGMVARIKLP